MKAKIYGLIGYICVKLYKPFSRGPINNFLNRELAEIEASRIASNIEKIRILNIGSGGDIYRKLKENPNFQIEQLDIDPARNPDIVADASDMASVKTETYDYVFAMEVLEHIPTPQDAVNEIFRVLKEDGKFIFSTPFIFPIHDEPHDYYRYTHYGLRHLLKGYKIKEITERNDYINAVLILLLRTIVIGNAKQRIASLLIYIFTIITYPLWQLLSWIFNCKLATTGYCGVAQKKTSNL